MVEFLSNSSQIPQQDRCHRHDSLPEPVQRMLSWRLASFELIIYQKKFSSEDPILQSGGNPVEEMMGWWLTTAFKVPLSVVTCHPVTHCTGGHYEPITRLVIAHIWPPSNNNFCLEGTRFYNIQNCLLYHFPSILCITYTTYFHYHCIISPLFSET